MHFPTMGTRRVGLRAETNSSNSWKEEWSEYGTTWMLGWKETRGLLVGRMARVGYSLFHCCMEAERISDCSTTRIRPAPGSVVKTSGSSRARSVSILSQLTSIHVLNSMASSTSNDSFPSVYRPVEQQIIRYGMLIIVQHSCSIISLLYF